VLELDDFMCVLNGSGSDAHGLPYFHFVSQRMRLTFVGLQQYVCGGQRAAHWPRARQDNFTVRLIRIYMQIVEPLQSLQAQAT